MWGSKWGSGLEESSFPCALLTVSSSAMNQLGVALGAGLGCPVGHELQPAGGDTRISIRGSAVGSPGWPAGWPRGALPHAPPVFLPGSAYQHYAKGNLVRVCLGAVTLVLLAGLLVEAKHSWKKALPLQVRAAHRPLPPLPQPTGLLGSRMGPGVSTPGVVRSQR